MSSMTELQEQYATLSLGIPNVKGKSVCFYFVLSVNICYLNTSMMNNEVWSASVGEVNRALLQLLDSVS